ncbi:MAG: terminase family protein [Holosporales bacterium]|jgi:phage terminase large subunit-like protein|nr:terminase family protein [Holosporales bacterium]
MTLTKYLNPFSKNCTVICFKHADIDQYDWKRNARENQRLPKGDWKNWMIIAGRGFGKTRTGAESVRQLVAEQSSNRIALVGRTIDETRSVMVEGVSGILSIYPPESPDYPTFEYSKRRVRWPNGALAQLFGADRYDCLRGPQFDLAWVDEFAKFKYPERIYEQLMFSLRLGNAPRCIITTTPRAIPFLKELIDEKTTVTTHGTTFDNEKNLPKSFIDYVKKKYGNSTLGRQELYAELLFDNKKALWQRRMIRYRAPEKMCRIVIAVDPAVTYNASSDETGIIVAGRDASGVAFVLEDVSGQYHPHAWGQLVVEKFHQYGADRVVAEVNQGGDLVEEVIRSFDSVIPYSGVRATRGKFVRAEPISALYEQSRVFHAQVFSKLEDQMCNFAPGESEKSPDRVDALVWGMTELFKCEMAPAVLAWR